MALRNGEAIIIPASAGLGGVEGQYEYEGAVLEITLDKDTAPVRLNLEAMVDAMVELYGWNGLAREFPAKKQA